MLRQCHPYHAPWSRWFKTFFMRGSFAWEVQIGPFVFDLFYTKQRELRRLHVWVDHYAMPKRWRA